MTDLLEQFVRWTVTGGWIWVGLAMFMLAIWAFKGR